MSDTASADRGPFAPALPTERVRTLAEIVRRAWEPFTDDERIDFLGLINADRAPLDRATIERMIAQCGTIEAAARALGVARRTLQVRMRDFGMARGKHGRRPK